MHKRLISLAAIAAVCGVMKTEKNRAGVITQEPVPSAKVSAVAEKTDAADVVNDFQFINLAQIAAGMEM